MVNDVHWYRCFAVIPGISYATPPGVEVESLPGYGRTPEVRHIESKSVPGYEPSSRFEPFDILSWGDTSESPAAAHGTFDRANAPATWIVQRIAEVLELPGTASDYHFGLAAAAEGLYARRYSEPSAMSEAERLWLLDVELIKARRDAFVYSESDGTPNYYGFASLARLASVYSNEGYLREALALNEKAEAFGQERGQKEKLLARLAAIEAEDEG